MTLTHLSIALAENILSRGQIIKRLLESHLRHDDEEFRATVLELIAEERRLNNHRFADQLLSILNSSATSKDKNTTFSWNSLPKDSERGLRLIETIEPQQRLNDVVLIPRLKEAVSRILEEFRRSAVLTSHGLPARSKILLCGPPGCGKTILAEAIATELGLPVLYVRFDAVVSSFLGETAANLRKVFDYATVGTWVLFFDEFDAIGKHRSDPEEHGEIKRVVNAFLQMLDHFKGHSLVVTATNHQGLLDPSLWRRFDEILYLDFPKDSEVRALLETKLRSIRVKGFDPISFIPRLRGFSHADIERICFDAARSAILADRDEILREDFEPQIARQRERLNVAAGKPRASSKKKR